jgi:hypothetical protein
LKNKEKIKKELKNLIKNNPESFPLIAQFWEIEIEDVNNEQPLFMELGKYNANILNSIPFYKPFSKLINLTIIEE